MSATAGPRQRPALRRRRQVRSHAGFDARRTADFVAMDLWPSTRLTLHGHEIKVSRSDWLRELKDPSKAAEFIPYMNYWWGSSSDPRIVRDGELPDDWGLMAMRGHCCGSQEGSAPRRPAADADPPRRALAGCRAHLRVPGDAESGAGSCPLVPLPFKER